MAHFAQLDENNLVTQVIVVHNNELLDKKGKESETKGIQFCKSLYGPDSVWVQTSYNGNIRKNYAGIGYTYDSTLDAFIAPKPYDSWVLDETTAKWNPPVPMPTDGEMYIWDESKVNWVVYAPSTT